MEERELSWRERGRLWARLGIRLALAALCIWLLVRAGEPPKTSPQENLQNLLKFGSQFDNIEIK